MAKRQYPLNTTIIQVAFPDELLPALYILAAKAGIKGARAYCTQELINHVEHSLKNEGK